MLNRRVGEWRSQFRQQYLLPFLLLAMWIMAISVVGYAIGASLFVDEVGASSVPLFQIWLGLLSIPVSFQFSRLIDRCPRPWLLRCLLLGSLVMVLLLRLLLFLDTTLVYYTLYIGLSLVDLLTQVIFWTLVADYFSPLEQERVTPLLGMAMTIGGFAGGLLVRGLLELITTRNLLLGLIALYGIAIAQVIYLERLELPANRSGSPADDTQIIPRLRSFPTLLKRYPILILFIVATFLSVLLWGISELQFFSIYSEAFPEQQDLAGLLGIINAISNAVELAVTYYITRPLIQTWGISRMNLLYPFTTGLSFLGLTFFNNLPAAIMVNLNYEALYSSLSQPVQNLNYNAIPHRFAGRVRIIIDGLFYPAFQALAGGLLWLAQFQLKLELLTISFTGLVLSGVYILVGYLTGKTYVRSMLSRLRSSRINFDSVNQGLVKLPDRYASEIRQLLTSHDEESQLLGLALALRVDNPGQFLAEVQTLLLLASTRVHQAVVTFLIQGAESYPEFHRYLRSQLVSDSAVVRGAVLEALITVGQPLSKTQLLFFLDDSSPIVQGIACVAVWLAETTDPEITLAGQQTWEQLTMLVDKTESDRVRQQIIQTLQQVSQRMPQADKTRLLIPLVQRALGGAGTAPKHAGLMLLAQLGQLGDSRLATLAANEAVHADPLVRAAAIAVLQQIQLEDTLVLVVGALEDSHEVVRQAAVRAIAHYGDASLPLLQGHLRSPYEEVVQATIRAIGQMGTRSAEEMLFQWLQVDYGWVNQTLAWQQAIPSNDSTWMPLAVALDDYHQRLLQRVTQVVSYLQKTAVTEELPLLVRSLDPSQRISAMETLASLPQRRFVQPILPLLEALMQPHLSPNNAIHDTDLSDLDKAQLVQDALQLPQRWIQVGALLGIASLNLPIPEKFLTYPDAIVRRVAHQLIEHPTTKFTQDSVAMSQLFFLKQVSILKTLSLDDMLSIAGLLVEQEFLRGEVIFQEGSRGNNFFILYKGCVLLLKKTNESPTSTPQTQSSLSDKPHQTLSRLEPGECFGEMELFDGLPRSATALAETDCVLLTLPRREFQTLLTQRPEIAVQMCRVLSLRLRETSDRLIGAIHPPG
jgi:hypothetical protein